MPSEAIQAKRTAWRERFDPRVPLAQQLDSPFAPAWQVAHVMQVSEATVYSSGKRYHAALGYGDVEALGHEVPCIILGHSHRFPSAAFITWFERAGQAGEEPPSMPPEGGTQARVEAGGHELLVTIRLVLEDGMLRALAELDGAEATTR